jgi:hypothetical protein
MADQGSLRVWESRYAWFSFSVKRPVEAGSLPSRSANSSRIVKTQRRGYPRLLNERLALVSGYWQSGGPGT